MHIKVVSKRNLSPELGWSNVYVGRPSALGNPFAMKSESDRLAVVAQYRKWLWHEINNSQSKALFELLALADRVKAGECIRLVCWCSPKKCHADVMSKVTEIVLDILSEESPRRLKNSKNSPSRPQNFAIGHILIFLIL